jgi:hypothetical protein
MNLSAARPPQRRRELDCGFPRCSVMYRFDRHCDLKRLRPAQTRDAPGMPTPASTFAAIDIGSNSCRIKIARVVAHRLKTVHEDREVTRLGASVFDTGLVSRWR